jgi:glycine C-acetyltransferase
MTSNEHGLSSLIQHLRRDKVAKLFMTLDKRFSGEHLKDLVVDEMGDHREMTVNGQKVINFGCDSFLGLDRDPRVRDAVCEGVRKWGTFSGASRLFYSIAACEQAEAKIAKWLGVEATLLYPSTTIANFGAIPGLVQPQDLLVIDRLGHNSMQEAAKIARANGTPVVELDPCTPEALGALLDKHKYQRCLVAVDGVYSMMGTTPPLQELQEVVRARRGTLYVDDAHGTGVYGPKGRGAAFTSLGRLDEIVMAGSLSKGFSCAGAFVTCTEELKVLLKVKSNTYIFSGPIPSPYLDAICTVCDILMSDEYEVLAGHLHGMIERFSNGLRQLNLPLIGGKMPIVSILMRDTRRTLQAGRWLFDHGYYVQSVAYPAVPVHQGLLRVQINANHTPEQVDGLLSALADLRQVIPFPDPEAVCFE